jgi:hypothetical protein
LKTTAVVDVGDKFPGGFSMPVRCCVPHQPPAVCVNKSITPLAGKYAKEVAEQLNGNKGKEEV